MDANKNENNWNESIRSHLKRQESGTAECGNVFEVIPERLEALMARLNPRCKAAGAPPSVPSSSASSDSSPSASPLSSSSLSPPFITPWFRLRKSLQFHLFVSQPPCGDASIICNPAQPSMPSNSSSAPSLCGVFRATGAKPVTGGEGGREGEGGTERGGRSAGIDLTVGVLRTKSGRSDLHPGARTLSMSCSDKLGFFYRFFLF